MEIVPVNGAYGAPPVPNDLTGVQPPQSQNDTDGMAWSGGAAGPSGPANTAAQTRAMERASGLGNRIDLYV